MAPMARTSGRGQAAGKPAAPRIPSHLSAHEGGLEPERDYDAVAFADADFAGQDAVGIRFSGCTLSGCGLDGTDLTRSSLRDVVAERLRAVGVELVGTGWLDVVVRDSLLAAPQLYEANLERVTFSGCKLDGPNFRDATLLDVRFEDCTLREPDFGRARLGRVSFPGSRLVAADFTQASLERVDLRGCELGVERGFGDLGGAVIDRAQLAALAPALAAHLGLEVRDD
jgi:uncharacterized protein YjbI with pentapeptide repeats